MSNRRIALVTGGAKRVGRAIALKFAGAGFGVVFTYLSSEAEAETLKADIARSGGAAIAVRADLTQTDSAVAAIASAIEPIGRLDALVNNASIYLPDSVGPSSAADAARMWAVHVQTPLRLCLQLENLLRQSRGHVINMVDLLAERPARRYLAYSASKAALANLTIGLARRLAPEVTVNGIAPGVVEWPNDYPEADRERYLARVPLARSGTPADVAELVHFLATAGAYITGQIIRLDGGRSIT